MSRITTSSAFLSAAAAAQARARDSPSLILPIFIEAEIGDDVANRGRAHKANGLTTSDAVAQLGGGDFDTTGDHWELRKKWHAHTRKHDELHERAQFYDFL